MTHTVHYAREGFGAECGAALCAHTGEPDQVTCGDCLELLATDKTLARFRPFSLSPADQREIVQALWEATNTLGLTTHFIAPRERRIGEAGTPREHVDATQELILALLRRVDPDCIA
jgi:hypothetical protein